jgi:hypothetical protein
MCLSCRELVVDIYVSFSYGFGGRQLCALLGGGCWMEVMCLSCRGLVVGSYVPFW